MQTLVTPIAQTTRQAEAAAQGPRELLIEELGLVSGGLPRGGWAAATVSPETQQLEVDPLPRGGWTA